MKGEIDEYSSILPVTHIVVVGFHHQLGPKMEYCYPPLDDIVEVDSHGLPPNWFHLPWLALPDGVHQAEEDYCFFTIPALPHQQPHIKILYGVASFRQIHVEKLKTSTTEYTRSQVQKAVCALCTVPYLGAIHMRLSSVTQAYFEQGDFEDTHLLRQMYNYLNSSLKPTINHENIFTGIPLSKFLLKFKRQFLSAFKLLLLEKRVVVYSAHPVSDSCNFILAMLSLIPKLLEQVFPSRALIGEKGEENYPNALEKRRKAFGLPLQVVYVEGLEHSKKSRECDKERIGVVYNDKEKEYSSVHEKKEFETCVKSIVDVEGVSKDHNSIEKINKVLMNEIELKENNKRVMEEGWELIGEKPMESKSDLKTTCPNEEKNVFLYPKCKLYTYISLRQLDDLQDLPAYWLAASNLIFKHRDDIFDVIIDTNKGTVDTNISSSRLMTRCLSLSAADKRFIDGIIDSVTKYEARKESGEILASTQWEGSDDWIRSEMIKYLESFLSSIRNLPGLFEEVEEIKQDDTMIKEQSVTEEEIGSPPVVWDVGEIPLLNSGNEEEHKEIPHPITEETIDLSASNITDFNSAFVREWFSTNNYLIWKRHVCSPEALNAAHLLVERERSMNTFETCTTHKTSTQTITENIIEMDNGDVYKEIEKEKNNNSVKQYNHIDEAPLITTLVPPQHLEIVPSVFEGLTDTVYTKVRSISLGGIASRWSKWFGESKDDKNDKIKES